MAGNLNNFPASAAALMKLRLPLCTYLETKAKSDKSLIFCMSAIIEHTIARIISVLDIDMREYKEYRDITTSIDSIVCIEYYYLTR